MAAIDAESYHPDVDRQLERDPHYIYNTGPVKSTSIHLWAVASYRAIDDKPSSSS